MCSRPMPCLTGAPSSACNDTSMLTETHREATARSDSTGWPARERAFYQAAMSGHGGLNPGNAHALALAVIMLYAGTWLHGRITCTPCLSCQSAKNPPLQASMALAPVL